MAKNLATSTSPNACWTILSILLKQIFMSFKKFLVMLSQKYLIFFKKRLLIVQHVIGELEIANFFLPKSSAFVERLTSDPTVPGLIPHWGS